MTWLVEIFHRITTLFLNIIVVSMILMWELDMVFKAATLSLNVNIQVNLRILMMMLKIVMVMLVLGIVFKTATLSPTWQFKNHKPSKLNEMNMIVDNGDVNVDYFYINSSNGSVINNQNSIDYLKKIDDIYFREMMDHRMV